MTGQKPALMILAAGIGSRYGGLKQLDPVGPSGETIIDYSVFDAIRAGFGKVVFVIRKDIEQAFREHIGSVYEDKIEVRYAFQEMDDLPAGFTVPEGRAKPWGTGQAILAAQEQIDEPFIVINADDFYGRHAFELESEFLQNIPKEKVLVYSLVGYRLRDTLSKHGTVSRAVCQCDEAGNLQSIIERTKIERDGDGAKYLDEAGQWQPLSGDELVSMNFWGFEPSIFPHLAEGFRAFLERSGSELKSEFLFVEVLHRLLHEKRARMKVLPSRDPWLGMTYTEDKPFVVEGVRNMVDKGAYPKALWG